MRTIKIIKLRTINMLSIIFITFTGSFRSFLSFRLSFRWYRAIKNGRDHSTTLVVLQQLRQTQAQNSTAKLAAISDFVEA